MKKNFVAVLILTLTISFPIYAETPAATASQSIQAGDKAFARGDYEEAKARYAEAVKTEPNNYFAVLFLGNTYFALKQWDDSIVWFSRAAEINPNIELAHRWWGDALIGQGKPRESRDKFIDALVAEPYNSKTHLGIKKWMEYAASNGVKYRINNPVVHVPVSVKDKTLLVSQDFGKGSTLGHEAWFGYGTTLMLEQSGTAFERETQAYRAVIAVCREQKYTKDTPGLDPSLATLLSLDEKGLLEPFILLTTKNQMVAEQYPAYRDRNLEKLRRYWEEIIQLQ